jgi:nucleotide-binding universal stress UspA family protein
MDRILLATDGSAAARGAERRAVELARDRGAHLHVLCVVDRRTNDEPSLSSAELRTIRAEDEGHRCVRSVRELAGDDAPVEGVVRHGVPHELILEYADTLDTDTIVLGAHGDHSRHLGGVARRVQRETEREVVVVDADAATPRLVESP